MSDTYRPPGLLSCPHCGDVPRWEVTTANGKLYGSIVCADETCYANLVSSAAPVADCGMLARKWNRRSEQSEGRMVATTNENGERQRRMSQARRVFVLAAKHAVEAGIATPVEAASAMGSAAVGVAFAAQGCARDEIDPINACVTEVADVIRRHVGEWAREKAKKGQVTE